MMKYRITCSGKNKYTVEKLYDADAAESIRNKWWPENEVFRSERAAENYISKCLDRDYKEWMEKHEDREAIIAFGKPREVPPYKFVGESFWERLKGLFNVC